MRMKIVDNNDLLELKIDIKCTNDIAYMDCALLLDRPEFLRLLPEYRKKHGIKNLIPYKKFHEWRFEKMDQDSIAIDEDLKKGITVEFITELNLPHLRFEEDTTGLCKRFNKPSYFIDIIEFAIVCGVVGDIAYQHTKMEVFKPDPQDSLPYPELP